MAFAVIRSGGKQYVARPGEKLEIEKLDAPEKGGLMIFPEVLFYADGERVEIGRPLISGAEVTAEYLDTKKDDKVIVFKKKRRKGYRVKRGHRQQYTQIEITSIN